MTVSVTRDPNNRTWFLDVGRLRVVLDLSPGHRRWPVHLIVGSDA